MRFFALFLLVLGEGLCGPYGTHSNQVIHGQNLGVVASFPDSGRKTAELESAGKESLPIQLDIKYGGLQQHFATFRNPKPLLDTIQEHEKYGNDGGKARAIGSAAVAAFEGLSNGLNAAVDVPFQKAKTIGRQITHSLNQVGAKLVGLA